MNDKNELCPFCGSNEQLGFKFTDTCKCGAAYCPNCDATGSEVRTNYEPVESENWHKEAIKEWNKRFNQWKYVSDGELPDDDVDCYLGIDFCGSQYKKDGYRRDSLWRCSNGEIIPEHMVYCWKIACQLPPVR